MKNVSEFKAKMTQIGSSRYILVPNKVREFEGIKDEDILRVIIGKIEEPTVQDIIEEKDQAVIASGWKE